jgi:hypothetical protein
MEGLKSTFKVRSFLEIPNILQNGAAIDHPTPALVQICTKAIVYWLI